MLFNSYEFLFAYLPVVFLLFFIIGRKSHQSAAGFLGLASLFFYSWLSIQALPILIGSIVINYLFGLKISATENKLWLTLAIIFNLGLLSFFKYANFFIDNVNYLSSQTTISILDIALPIGISFFTFTQIAFLVDCYQGKVKEKTLLITFYLSHTSLTS
jgi:alginate O-acetyltransferase complex protein AlgI